MLSVINQRVKGAIQSHGGDIELKGIKNGTVFIKLKGACVGCPSSQATLNEGVEKMLKKFFPEIKEVKEVF